MAFFSPLGALSAFGAGAVKGYTDDSQKLYDMMGMQALGRAFQQVQGPIGGLPTVGAQPTPQVAQAAPQPPMPGQPSAPTQPPMGGPQGGGQGPSMQGPGMQGPPQPPSGAGQPPGGGSAMPGGGGIGGGMDLQSLAARIQQANPKLLPQAMVSALLRAAPLLNLQGKQDLAQLSLQLRTEMAQERLQQGEERLNLQRQLYGLGPTGGGGGGSGGSGGTSSGGGGQAGEIADAIISGQQPPVLTGLYRMGAPVRVQLAEKKFDLAKAQQEWQRAQKQIQALNGPQMTRYAGLAGSVVNTIDEVKRLSEEMNNSGVPLLNRAKLTLYAQAEGNTANGQLAARYLAAVNTLKEEFANLAQGGYAPTESAWALANQQINGDFGVKQFGASLDEVQRLIRYRLQGIPNFQSLGPSAPNRYNPGGGQGGSIMPGGEQIIGGGSGGGDAIDLGGGVTARRVQ